MTGTPEATRYDIRVAGHLAPRWFAFFDGMSLSPQDDGTTVIRGPIADQAALHGLLRKLSDLGLPLVAVTPTATAGTATAAPEPDAASHTTRSTT